MGIVRRCGRPPRLAPVKKPTRELAPFELPERSPGNAPVPIGALRSPRTDVPRLDAALPRTVTPCSSPVHYRLDRRLPPRLDLLARGRGLDPIVTEVDEVDDGLVPGDAEPVICSCSVHRADERPTLEEIRAPDGDPGA
jgi:hypothetical protein